MKGKKVLFMLGLVGMMGMSVVGCGSKQSVDKENTTEEEKEKKQETTDDHVYKDAYTVDCDTDLICHDYWFDAGVNAIMEKYDTTRQNEIIFYGPSNFARWTTMDEDMSEYKVQNHAFGGSTDVELVGYAPKILFPYNPSVVFFQTGSNDYVQQEGTDAEKIEKCMNYKKAMFADFHAQMPDAKFVVMSGLLLPGRSEYVDMTIALNEQLEKLASETDYIYYVDANAMTYDGSTFREDLFEDDMIHLNHDGQMTWYNNYIKTAIEQVIKENGMDYLRK